MRLTLEFVQEHNACSDGIKFAKENNLFRLERAEAVKKLIELKELQYANWLIIRVMAHKERISYAIFAAELVIKNYEDAYPDDDRPRKAIEAAKNYLQNPSIENRSATDSAAYSANLAAFSACSADSAACSADSAAYSAYSACSAAYSANLAAYSADSACSAAYSAARSAGSAARSARSAADNILTRMLNYGLDLLEAK